MMRYVDKFKEFVSESKRVLRVTKKPTKDEYLTISKVSAIGILVIGFIGFLLHFIDEVAGLAVLAVVTVILIAGFMYWKQ